MERPLLYLILAALIGAFSCQSDDANPSPVSGCVILTRSVNESFDTPAAESYAFTPVSKTRESLLTLRESNHYHDAILMNENIFTLCSDGIIRRANALTFEVQLTVPLYAEVNFNRAERLPIMAQFNGQLLIAGSVDQSEDKGVFLKFYDEDLNLQDSLVTDDFHEIRDLVVIGTNIYLNAGGALTFVVNKKLQGSIFILFPTEIIDLVAAGDTLLAATANEVTMFDGKNFGGGSAAFPASLGAFESATVEKSYSTQSVFAYDKHQHRVFYVSKVSTVVEHQYVVSALDLHTGATQVIPETRFAHPPIAYDSRQNIIIVGIGTDIFFKNESGVVLGIISVPVVDKLLLRERTPFQ